MTCFLGDGQNAPKFVGCIHRCGEEHLGSASKTERGTHRCSVKSVGWWIRFTRKWSKPEVKTGDFLNTSGSLKPIRSNWLAQALFCVTQSCCHARYQLKHREYFFFCTSGRLLDHTHPWGFGLDVGEHLSQWLYLVCGDYWDLCHCLAALPGCGVPIGHLVLEESRRWSLGEIPRRTLGGPVEMRWNEALIVNTNW